MLLPLVLVFLLLVLLLFCFFVGRFNVIALAMIAIRDILVTATSSVVAF